MPSIIPPRSLPLARIAATHRRDDLVVSVATAAEYAEVEALARAADPSEIFRPLTAPLISWFADANPAGPGFLVVARPATGGQIVGHFLFYAHALVHRRTDDDVELPAYLYVHLYVSPEYRRRGVFTRMFEFGLDVLGGMGVPLAYTVPNQRSAPGFVKFGVPLLGMLPVRMAPAWTPWVAATRITAGSARGLSIERVGRFDDRMLGGRPPGAAVRGVRTTSFMNWRFTQRPDAEYGIFRVSGARGPAGYAVTRVLEIQRYRVLAVCDLALDPFDAPTAAAVLRHVAGELRAERPNLLMVQGGPPDAASRRALLRAGLVLVPNRALPQPVAVFGGATGRPGSTAGLPPVGDWCLTPGDWDVF